MKNTDAISHQAHLHAIVFRQPDGADCPVDQSNLGATEKPDLMRQLKEDAKQTCTFKHAIRKLVLVVVLSNEARGPISEPAEPEGLGGLLVRLPVLRWRQEPRIQVLGQCRFIQQTVPVHIRRQAQYAIMGCQDWGGAAAPATRSEAGRRPPGLF